MTEKSPLPIPRGAATVRKAESKAMPVTMPGRASGRTISSEMDSRPKNRNRPTAKDTIVPSTSAMAVAPSAAFTEVHRAFRAPWFSHARAHHSVVQLDGGQANVRSALNELISTIANGT